MEIVCVQMSIVKFFLTTNTFWPKIQSFNKKEGKDKGGGGEKEGDNEKVQEEKGKKEEEEKEK